MSTLLVQSCSKSKNRGQSPGAAFDIYDGYYYRILKKARNEGEFVSGLAICILSAKYGLVDPMDDIEVYDRRMNRERAAELRDEVTEGLRERVEESGYERIVVNAGKTYRRAIDSESIPVPVDEIDGGGLGEKGQNLKRFVRGETAVLKEDT